MNAFRELELKLEGDAGDAAALRKHPLLTGVEPRTIEQCTTYFDTPDEALRKAGLSLRVRRAGDGFVQTVKAQGNGGAGLFDRDEWEWPVAGAEPDLGRLWETPARAVINGQPVSRTVEAEASRSIWMLRHEDSSIELVIDEGRIAGNGAEQAIAEVEIELKQGDEAALFALGRELVGAAGLRIGVLTKAERGQRLADGSAGKAAKAERIALSDEMTVAEGFATIVHSCLRQFRLNEPLLTGRRDPEALHQARVAMRRLRSAFSLFRRAIADKRYEALREELRWFTGELGDARNLDVMLKRIPADDADSAVAETLRELREDAYERLLAAIGSQRLRILLFDIVAWVETGKWRHSEAARQPLRKFARHALTRRWKKVKEGVVRLGDDDPEARHALRIEVKKLRYAAEFLSSLGWGHKAEAKEKKFLRALETMQEQLGELNDQETGRRMFADLLGDRPHGAQLVEAAERLIGCEDAGAKPLVKAQAAALGLVVAGPYWR